MLTTFFISVVLDLASVVFSVFPSLGSIVSAFTAGLVTVLGYALQWEWLLPIQEGLQLVVINLQFQIAIGVVFFVKWLIEMFFDAV